MNGSSVRPIIIVGAGRSGTKMLRTSLALHPAIRCFPKEINYIWRYGNATLNTDELKPEQARPEVIHYIHSRFNKLSGRNNRNVVEKTCANSLRVDFVRTIFPDARIIHLVRDGRAVAESARRCWKGQPSVNYLLKKACWVPPRDIPYYAFRYIRYQLGRFSRHDTKQKSWGPRFAGLDELVKEKTLIEVCGIQWKVCVQAAESAMKDLPSDQTITLRYEDIIDSSLSTIGRLFEKINLAFTPECQAYVMRTVTAENVNKWQHDLSEQDMRMLMPHIENELLQHGYEI